MRQLYSSSDVEAVILVDASNAFNSLNRQAALHNILKLCPSFSTVLISTYQSGVNLYIGGVTLLSEVGTIHGDPLVIPTYASSTIPLINVLSDGRVKQAWHYDDASACSGLLYIRRWWDKLVTFGPDFGYFPNASMTSLIVKDCYYDFAVSIYFSIPASLWMAKDILELPWVLPLLLSLLRLRKYCCGNWNSLCYQIFQ